MEEVLVVISCFVNIVLWFFFFFYFKKKFSSQQILENIRQEVDKLLIEISRETDNDLSLLEDKMNALKELIEKADHQIKQAKKEQKKQKKEESLQNRKAIADNSTAYGLTYPVDDIRHRYIDLVENTPVMPFSEKTEPLQKKTENISKPEKSIREKVLELWKLGIDPESISEKLEVSLTEIRMIIDMYG